MKFIPLHTKNTAIIYKNSLCSSASIIVLIFIILSVMIPLLLVSLLSPYSGISESRILFEQPRLQFKFQSILIAETEGEDVNNSQDVNFVVCSALPQINTVVIEHNKSCEGIKVSNSLRSNLVGVGLSANIYSTGPMILIMMAQLIEHISNNS